MSVLAEPVTARRGRFHPLTVARVDPLCDDAAAVTFDVPEALAGAYAFDAGQSLTVRRTVDGREHRRSYSICSPAGSAPRIGVREIPDGLVSRWLVRDVRPGDTVEVLPPSGSMRLGPATTGRHLCIAAGSGITPVLSVAASALARADDRVTLLYANRSTSSVMFADDLADLKDRYGSRLDLVHVLSREPRDTDLFSGRLDAARLRRLLDALVPLDAVDHVWLCGPFGLVTDARQVLDERGVARDRVHVELFHVDEPPPAPLRPEAVASGETSRVSIVLDGRTATTSMPRDRTILDGAAAVRDDLPFACRGGVCGTCRARVVSGRVDMRRNYALDDDEVAAGFVLSCQTHAVDDEVTVDFDA